MHRVAHVSRWLPALLAVGLLLRADARAEPPQRAPVAIPIPIQPGPAPPLTTEPLGARERRRAVRFTVALPEPASQYVEVTMTVTRATRRATSIAMPAWIPGSYKIRDFARHVDGLRAETLDGRPLAVHKRDKQTWTITNRRRGFRVVYRVFADELSVRTNFVDAQHALLSSPALFLYLVGQEARPAEIELRLPPGWRAYAPLPTPTPDDPTPRYLAASYDELVDAPFMLGRPDARHFSIAGRRVELLLSAVAGANLELDRAAAEARDIVVTFSRLMGGLPFARYTMFLEAGPHGGGGLEHERSAMMMVQRDGFSSEGGYARLAHLVAHEFFHLWNVKRIHDRALGPFDYTREVHSRLLWFHEGFTETVENQALVRAGLTEPQDFLSALAGAWTSYRRKPGRDHEPISLVSHDAWTRLYQSSARDANTLVSYYEKGHLIGVALDLELRLRAGARGRRGSLVGVFRRLMASHGARDRGIDLDDIIAAASAEAGEDMRWFFRRHVEGTTPLQLPPLLEAIGVRVINRAPWEPPPPDPQLPAPPPEPPSPDLERLRTWTGMQLSGTRVHNVEPRSPAAIAGLMIGDELIAIDRRRVDSQAAIEARVADHRPGERLVISLFRDGQLLERAVVPALNPHREFSFELIDAATLDPKVLRLRDAWLGTCDPAGPVNRCVLRPPAP